jgi:hypothetical protein
MIRCETCLPTERMGDTDRVFLMLNYFLDLYNNELFRLKRKELKLSPKLTEDDIKINAKKIVCNIGISMYKFEHHLQTIYNKSIQQKAIHSTVDKGIVMGFLNWGSPYSYDEEHGMERKNIVLTEDGFKSLFEPGQLRVMKTLRAAYLANFGGKKY